MSGKFRRDFINQAYNDFCTCEKSCIPTGINTPKPDSKCAYITLPDNVEFEDGKYFLDKIHNTVYDFKKQKLLEKSLSGRFYIHVADGTRKRLSWKNIKKMSKEDQEIFWMFRKVIVDSIIKYILVLLLDKPKVTVISVGSTSLSSDYDITLYGDNKGISLIIERFNNFMQNFFKADSNIIFDTNLYGTSFITISDMETSFKCSDMNFIYEDKVDITANSSQTLWSLVHYYKILNGIFSIDTVNKIWDNLIDVSQGYGYAAKIVHEYITDNDFTYEKILQGSHGIPGKLYRDFPKIVRKLDNVSFANFHADEVYLSRGAFMDVVVNDQMCKTKLVDLTRNEYYQSIVENTAFFMVHTKEKYIKRIARALDSYFKDNKHSSIYIELANFTRQINTLLSDSHTTLEVYLESQCKIQRQSILFLQKFTEYNINDYNLIHLEIESSPVKKGLPDTTRMSLPVLEVAKDYLFSKASSLESWKVPKV